MRVFLAGAGGAVGQRLIPVLIQAGHTVGALTRSEGKREMLSQLGALVFIADALNAEPVNAAIETFRPDAIVNQLTAIPQQLDLRHFDRDFALTNRLRVQGTDNLLAAGERAGVLRFVAQSFAGWPYARVGSRIKSEDDPHDSNPPAKFRASLDAIKHLESSVLRRKPEGGIVLRYGAFYGPGTSLYKGGSLAEAIRKRKVPIVAGGTGIWSFVHIDDVVTATLAALAGELGIYNVVDDEPVSVGTWIMFVAEILKAKPPFHIPAWLARPIIGQHGIALMRDARGASNEKAKRKLDWKPAHPSWREGFRNELL
jgi:nucleoside-diphosphate-sugar epimerase